MKKESSFSEKKEAKRLLCLRLLTESVYGLDRGSSAEVKVFWFFFSKKNFFTNDI